MSAGPNTAAGACVLQNGPLPAELEAGLGADGHEVVCLHALDDPAGWLRAHGARCEALVTSVPYGADAGLLAALPSLRVICNVGVGTDRIDWPAVRSRGIAVSNTPDLLDDCVADLAMGMLIDCARRLRAADHHVRQGHWARSPYPLTTRVTGKRLGILGLGRIGRAVAQRAEGFRLAVRYHNRQAQPEVPWHFEPALQALAAWADFLVVACPGGAATRHLVSADVLRALGPDGYLVNVSRGSVVDEVALVKALTNGQLGGAALDVFENEPRVPAALLGLDNVLLLPHMASGTREARRDMGLLALENLRSFLARGELLTPVA